jgi:endo-1,4-beta-xylanase
MNASPLAGVNERIKKNRFMDATLCVRKTDGTPLADAEIEIEQTAHEFLFGQTGGNLLPGFIKLRGWNDEQVGVFKERIKEFFNFVTLPFYWGRFEPVEGQPNTEALRELATWYTSNGIACKGHTLCWHTVCADWLMQYPNDVILQKQRDRVRRDVTAFTGLVDMWDVINEVCIMSRYDKYDNAITRVAKEYGADTLAEMLFRDAMAANPKSRLILNDFILNKEYEDHVEHLLAHNTPIDIIGLQTHMHQGYRGADTIWDYIERFSRFGKPLHFTENTLVSGELMPAHIVDLNDFKQPDWPSTPEGEERQVEQAVEFYSLAYSHPAVQSIGWWDFVDGGWLSAPAGLLRRDLSLKPVFHALKKLIKGEWWTGRRKLKTDARGEVKLASAVPGTYRLASRGGGTAFSVTKTIPYIEIQF